MYVDVRHKTWDKILPYIMFDAETTQFLPFCLVYGRNVQTMLDAMLPCYQSDELSPDTEEYAQYIEEARQLAHVNISHQQGTDAGHYNLRHRDVAYYPSDQVWVWTPIRRPGLSENLLSRYFGPY